MLYYVWTLFLAPIFLFYSSSTAQAQGFISIVSPDYWVCNRSVVVQWEINDPDRCPEKVNIDLMDHDTKTIASPFASDYPADKLSFPIILPANIPNAFYYIRIGDPNINRFAYSGSFNIIQEGDIPKPPLGSEKSKKVTVKNASSPIQPLHLLGAVVCLLSMVMIY